MRRFLLTATTMLLLSAGAAWAGPLEDAEAAYQRGNYTEAVRWFQLAAAHGDTTAQFDLGVMYANGRGVTQDYVRAHMWFNLSGAFGDATGLQDRDIIAARMTPQQIAEAQHMAWECQQRDFKDCDAPGQQSRGWDAAHIGWMIFFVLLIITGGYLLFRRSSAHATSDVAMSAAIGVNALSAPITGVKPPRTPLEQPGSPPTAKPVHEPLRWVAFVVAALCPVVFVTDMPSLMLLMRLRFPGWLFVLYVLFALRNVAS